MKSNSLKDCVHKTTEVSEDLMNLAIAICGDSTTAEKFVLDTLLISLESGWIVDHNTGAVVFDHFRDNVCRHLWQSFYTDHRHQNTTSSLSGAIQQIDFFQLPLRERSALVMKSRLKLCYIEIATVLDLSEEEVRNLVENAREKMLHEPIVSDDLF